MSYLILVRHGESEWNAKGLWTGWQDIPLSEKGREEARSAGEKINAFLRKVKNLPIDLIYNSSLLRTKQTTDEIKKVLNKTDISTLESEALNERNYGDYMGKNKWDVKKEVGDEEFQKIRRSYDYPTPNGESLKQVYNRVVPYFEKEILPRLCEGKNILISAHGNSLRALVKYLDKISDDGISKLEIPTGEVYVYEIGQDGQIVNKEILT